MIEYSLSINVTPEKLWDYLTKPDLMRLWMGEPELELAIETEWIVNSQILVKGFHHVRFENKGVVEIFEKYKRLKYSNLSSLSRLPDRPENYTSTEFILEPAESQTRLVVKVENFPTDTIYKHYNFYWMSTVLKTKNFVEILPIE